MGSKQCYKTQDVLTDDLWCIAVTKLKVRMEERFLTTEKTTSKNYKQRRRESEFYHSSCEISSQVVHNFSLNTT